MMPCFKMQSSQFRAQQYPANPGQVRGEVGLKIRLSPTRRSGYPVNLIAITLFNLDIETNKNKKKINFRFDVISVYFSPPFHFHLYPCCQLYCYSKDPVMHLIYFFNVPLISILMLDSQTGAS